MANDVTEGRYQAGEGNALSAAEWRVAALTLLCLSGFVLVAILVSLGLDAVLYLAEHMHTYPALIVACLEFDERPADIAASSGSIWPGVKNVLLAARAHGLGAVPTTYAINRRQEFEAIIAAVNRKLAAG